MWKAHRVLLRPPRASQFSPDPVVLGLRLSSFWRNLPSKPMEAERYELVQHESRKGDQMQTCHGGRKPLIVTSQLVNTLRSEQVMPSNMSICPQM
jgi:hypothetical protein